MRQHDRETTALKAYEADTKGIYEYRFKPQVDKAIKVAGLSNGEDWKLSLDTSCWLVPYSESIKAIGHLLSQLADKLDEYN
jgi:hypothetical protein